MEKFIIISDARENILIQCLTLTPQEVTKWYEKAVAKNRKIDVYNVKKKELGFYMINARLIAKTSRQEELIRKFISE